MRYPLVVFDMDGTILDTLEDLTDAVNYALEKCGYMTRSIEEVRAFVGNGVGKLIERAVPTGTSQENTQKTFDIFMPYYREHSMVKTRPYDGIVELLKVLKAAGIKTAVVSNKADPAVQDLVEECFDGLFDYALGERPGLDRKPAPAMVELVLKELGFTKQQAVYIGDSDVDIATAKNSGLNAILVEWGFRDREFLLAHGADIIVKNTDELKDILL